MPDAPKTPDIPADLIEASCEAEWNTYGTRSAWADVPEPHKDLVRWRHRRILAAVLPLALAEAGRALEPMARWADLLDEVVELPGGSKVPSWTDDNIPPSNRGCAKVGDLRAARTALANIKAVVGS